MKKQLLLLPSAVLSALCWLVPDGLAQQPSPSPAASPTVEDRVQKLEGDIGQILQILKGQGPAASGAAQSGVASAPANPPAPAAPSAPASAPVTLKPGAILELWLLRGDFSGDAPTGRSIGGILDQGDYFNLLNFTAEKSLATYQSNRIALKWSGLFRAKESGVYVFTLEWSCPAIDRGDSENPCFWVGDLSIDGQTLIKEAPQISRNHYNWYSLAYSASSEVQLEGKGIYPLTILTFLSSSSNLPTTDWNYDKMKLTLKVRGPSDMTPRVITSDDLFHKK
jgi:hypothetical protein